MRNIAIFSAAAVAAVAFSGVAHANHHEMKKGAKMEANAEHHGKEHKKMKQDHSTDANQHGQEHKMMKQGHSTDANQHGQEHKMDQKMTHKMDHKAKVIKQGTKGRAQTVMLNGKEYQVCGGTVTDNCINPREAGLSFGNRALDYWPGKPASEM